MAVPGMCVRRWRRPVRPLPLCWAHFLRKLCLLPAERKRQYGFPPDGRETGGGIGVLSTDHDASLKTALALGCGCVCPVDREGRAIPEKWESMCAGGVSGVSFAWANNETGALQDAPVLCSSARKHGVPVHLDIVQCAGKIPVDLHGMEVDYASVSAHKFHGPKGIGCLYRRAGAPFFPFAVRRGAGVRLEVRHGECSGNHWFWCGGAGGIEGTWRRTPDGCPGCGILLSLSCGHRWAA